MNRRLALRNVALVVAGTILLPACDLSKPQAEELQAFFSPNEQNLLAEIAETFIPASDTPGAKDLGVPEYIHRMVTDCYDMDTQQDFLQGLLQVDKRAENEYSKTFAALDMEERVVVLKSMESSNKEADRKFFGFVKGLSIAGFMTSEYVMTNHTDYKMIPGHYYGCIPVPNKKAS